MITNIEQLALHFGGDPRRIGKSLFTSTECGITFAYDDKGVTVTGYAEGSDAECTPIPLLFPFLIAEFWDAVQHADEQGVDLWDEWHGDDDQFGDVTELDTVTCQLYSMGL